MPTPYSLLPTPLFIQSEQDLALDFVHFVDSFARIDAVSLNVNSFKITEARA
jgi:hypothetical protein